MFIFMPCLFRQCAMPLFEIEQQNLLLLVPRNV